MTPTPTPVKGDRRSELRELLERVEKCTGPSPEVDRDIYRALGCTVYDRGYWTRAVGGGHVWAEKWCVEDRQGRFNWNPERLTSSIDAALALVKRVLPGWWWKIGSCHVSDDACVCPDWGDPEHGDRLKAEFGHMLEPGNEWDCGFDVDRRPPGNVTLALCEALLRALIAIEEAKTPAEVEG